MNESQSGAKLSWQNLGTSQRVRLTSDLGNVKAGTNGTIRQIFPKGDQVFVSIEFEGHPGLTRLSYAKDERNDDSEIFEKDFTTRILTKDSGLVVTPISYTGDILTLTVNDRSYEYRIPPQEWERVSKLLGYNVGRGLGALRKFLIRENGAILYNYFDPEEMIQRVLDGEEPEHVLTGDL